MMMRYPWILLLSGLVYFVGAVEFITPGQVKLEKRQNCITCPANPPACPVCPAGQECQITSQSCTQCAQSQCIPSATLNQLAGNTGPSQNRANTGAIAGGIVGALICVGIIAGGLFWYLRKKRGVKEDMDHWLDNTKMHDMEKKGGRESRGSQRSDGNLQHHSIAETMMTRASNVIPIGYIPSRLRGTMMSTETGLSDGTHHDSMISSLPSPRSHPPTQFFSADDILRASLATSNRDTRYTDRDTIYSNRDSVGTTYTRASVATTAYRSTAIIAAAPVPVAVRAQPKIITFGKVSTPTSPIPAVPHLTAEKVAEAERTRAASIAPVSLATPPKPSSSPRSSIAGLGLDIPIQIQSSSLPSPKLSTLSIATPSPTTDRPPSSSFDDIPESPILGASELTSLSPTPLIRIKTSESTNQLQDLMEDLQIMLTPTSPTSPHNFDDNKGI